MILYISLSFNVYLLITIYIQYKVYERIMKKTSKELDNILNILKK